MECKPIWSSPKFAKFNPHWHNKCTNQMQIVLLHWRIFRMGLGAVIYCSAIAKNNLFRCIFIVCVSHYVAHAWHHFLQIDFVGTFFWNKFQLTWIKMKEKKKMKTIKKIKNEQISIAKESRLLFLMAYGFVSWRNTIENGTNITEFFRIFMVKWVTVFCVYYYSEWYKYGSADNKQT